MQLTALRAQPMLSVGRTQPVQGEVSWPLPPTTAPQPADGALDAVLFQRDCGATTGFSTQVSVVSLGQQSPDEPASAFVADCDHGAAPSASWGGPPAAMAW